MSAPAIARRYQATTYEAFRLDAGKSARLQFPSPATLEEAVAIAQQGMLHKEMLAIRATDEDGQTAVHLYQIKRRAAPDYVADGFLTRRVQRLYADPVCVLSGAVLA